MIAYVFSILFLAILAYTLDFQSAICAVVCAGPGCLHARAASSKLARFRHRSIPEDSRYDISNSLSNFSSFGEGAEGRGSGSFAGRVRHMIKGLGQERSPHFFSTSTGP
jgi:hypothetical protein